MGWPENLELAKKDSKRFIEKGKKIVKRYRDERGDSGSSSTDSDAIRRYNILWSNIKTLFPAVYSKKPRAQVERRYKDADPVGRTASQILERALQYEIDHNPDFDSALRGCVLDRLLPGRGVAWVRFDGGDGVTDDVTAGEDPAEVTGDDGSDGEISVLSPAVSEPVADPAMAMPSLLGMLPAQPPKKTDPSDYECTPCDYVYWEDFRHSPARTWEEVTWVARRVYMGPDELKKRFPTAKDVPLKHEPIGLEKDTTATDEMKKAIVWEIWDKPSKKVIWRAEGYTEDLDSKDDTLGLDAFFPCPKPLFATMTTDTIQPIADYLEYQDQAMELDELTTRIYLLTRAVKAVGVYDASQPSIQRLMQEGVDNTLIPVENWAAFGGAGGLKGTVELLPMDMIVGTLNELYKARDICKAVIYEVTGLSDIIRGSSEAQETATAQQIKSNFASLRLKETTQDVARFASDLLNMKAQMMGKLYRPETLKEMSGIMMTEDAQFADQAIQLIQNESMRCYRIEVAADSMVELDEAAEKQSRLEFVSAAGDFLQKAVQAAEQAPQLVPLMGEILMFGVRSFKAARPIEAAFEQAMQQMQQPQPPRPNPEMMKVQGHMQIEQAKLQASGQQHQAELQQQAQLAQVKAQYDQQTAEAVRNHEAQLEQMRAQLQAQVDTNRDRSQAEQTTQKLQQDAQLEQLKAQNADQAHQREQDNLWRIEQLKSATAIEVARTNSLKTEDAATNSASAEVVRELPPAPDFTPIVQAAQAMTAAAAQMTKPRKRTLVRGPDGKATGMIEE